MATPGPILWSAFTSGIPPLASWRASLSLGRLTPAPPTPSHPDRNLVSRPVTNRLTFFPGRGRCSLDTGADEMKPPILVAWACIPWRAGSSVQKSSPYKWRRRRARVFKLGVHPTGWDPHPRALAMRTSCLRGPSSLPPCLRNENDMATRGQVARAISGVKGGPRPSAAQRLEWVRDGDAERSS